MNIGLLLLSASWLVKDHFRPWLSFHSEIVAFAGLATMLAACLWRRRETFSVPFILQPLLLIASIPILQYAVGLTYFAGDALVTTIYLLGFGFSVWVGFVAGRDHPNAGRIAHIAFSIALPALISAAIGWCQWFMVDDFYLNFVMPSDSGMATGNLAQPNLLGTLLLMGLVALTFLFHLRAIGAGTLLFCVFFVSAAIAMTQSRAAMVGAFVLALFLIVKRKQYLPQLSTWQIGGWFFAFLCGRAVMPLLAELLYLPGGIKTRPLTSASGRWEIWEQVLSAIFQEPWLGYGWNQTFRAQTVGAHAHPNEITYTYAHNVVLDLLAWNGIPLGILIVLAAACWLVARAISTKTPASLFAMGALLPVVAQSVFEFPFAYANFLITAGLLIGVIESRLDVGTRLVLRIELILASYAAFLVIGALVTLEYVKVEEDFRIVRFENLRIGDTPINYEVPHFKLLTHMGAMLDAARSAPAPGMSPDQIATLREASHRFPYGLLMYKYAVALALNGDPAGGIRQMIELRAIYGEKYYLQNKPAFTAATGQQLP